MDAPIGIFDSGIGGLTVMRRIAELLPHENLVYLGDTARVPYGNRGPETIRRYSLNAADYLVKLGIKALVVACNTATAHGLLAIQQAWPELIVIGVIEPVARLAAHARKVGVIATRATIQSGLYEAHLKHFNPLLEVTTQACPLLVPLAEEGWLQGDAVESILNTYLAAFDPAPPEILILGCTHYPLFEDLLGRLVQHRWRQPVQIQDSGMATTRELIEKLRTHHLLRPPQERTLRFLATDDSGNFMRTARAFFDHELSSVEHIDLPDTFNKVAP